jgi:hypothetical protein
MSNLYQPYQTPAGCHDVPFIYLFDGTDLVNGQDYVSRLSLKTDADSEFILRRIAGANSVGGFFTYRNPNSPSYVWQPPAVVTGPQGDISVLREKKFAPGASIRFDILGVAKAVAASGGTDYLSYIAFQGAKRFPYEVQQERCPYRLRSYQYVLNIPAVDWTRGEYRRFTKRIEHTGDFELDRIIQVNATNVPDQRVGVFNYMLYDPNNWQMMSAPVPDSYICDQINGILTTDPAPEPGVFPVPAMLYPRMSRITVDLFATESIPQGDCWQIIFDGMERIPLSGDEPVYS